MSNESKAPAPDKYAGACWNQLMENESKESIAELYMDQMERIARLEQENKHDAALDDYQGRLWCALGQPMGVEFIQAVRELREENAHLRAAVERLTAPVSDEEISTVFEARKSIRGQGLCDYEAVGPIFTAIIAARAAETGKENRDGA